MTIYSRRRSQAVSAALILFVLAATAYSHRSKGLAIGLAASGALAAVYVLRRPRLQVGPTGLVVANLARTYRIRWSEIVGFGFGSRGMVPCLTIRRRDGSVVSAVVVTDDVRSGYPSGRVQAIIADLQERLAAANGTSLDPELDSPPQPRVEPRARLVSRRIQGATWFLLCLFFVVFGVATAWKAASGLPRTYSYLSSHGVRATAVFMGCRVTEIRDTECRLALTYRGHTRTWDYPENLPQFDHLPIGAPVPVLVDPEHPTTVYTVRDVSVRSNAGFGVLGILGVVMAVAGALGSVWPFWTKRRFDRKLQRIVRAE